MSVDFPDLLYRTLPGIYRDKDARGELRRYLEIVSLPLEEIEQSIGQLYRDLFIDSCRKEFVSLIGYLVGVEFDPALPLTEQRAEVGEAFAFYRSKGPQPPLETFARRVTGWAVTLVDFSQTVARVPFLEGTNPIITKRNQPVAENPPGSGRFFFQTDQSIFQLYDARRGRPISRVALAGREAEFAGVEGRFAIKERGREIFTTGTPPPYTAIAADLTNFANPKTPTGSALTVQPKQVAVDPALGRFLIVNPLPLAGNLTVDFQTLVPASVSVQTFDIRDPARMDRLNRSDDPAPYTLDFRAPRKPGDKIGRQHFDNHGFFFTVGHPVANQTPNALPPGSQTGRFTFDNRPLASSDNDGIALQLLDGIDGSPLTRRSLQGREKLFCGTPRGFSIRILGRDICDPAFQPKVTVRSADLSNFSQPKDPNGGNLVLAPTGVAVDPQLGRFLLNLAALGATAEQLRVDFLLGPFKNIALSVAFPLSSATKEIFAFAPDGSIVRLRDGFDGTPISIKIRLGATVADFHGKARGWMIWRNGVEIGGTLQSELKSLDDFTTAVTPGKVAIDPERGRLKFAAGFLTPGDQIAVSFSYEDAIEEEQRFSSFSQRLARVLPAGVMPVLIDSRQAKVDPTTLR